MDEHASTSVALAIPTENALAQMDKTIDGIIARARDIVRESNPDGWEQLTLAERNSVVLHRAVQLVNGTEAIAGLLTARLLNIVEEGAHFANHPEGFHTIGDWMESAGLSPSAYSDLRAIDTMVVSVVARSEEWTLEDIMDPDVIGRSKLRVIVPHVRKAWGDYQTEAIDLDEYDAIVCGLLKAASESSARELRDTLSEPRMLLPYPDVFDASGGKFRLVFVLTEEQKEWLLSRLSRNLVFEPQE